MNSVLGFNRPWKSVNLAMDSSEDSEMIDRRPRVKSEITEER